MLEKSCPRCGLYAVLFLGALLAGVSVSNFVPMLPVISNALSTPADYVQLSLPAFMFSFAFAQLFYGTISDRYGRRKPYIMGICFYLMGSLVCFFATNISLFIIGRFIQGAGIGCAIVIAIAILRDIHQQPLVKSFAYLMITAILGFLFAPLLILLTNPESAWRFAYLGLAIYAGLLLILTVLFLPETNLYFHEKNVERTFFIKNYLQLLTDRKFMGYLLTSCLLFCLPLIVFCTMPVLLATAFQLSMQSYTWLTLLNIGFYLFGIYLGYLISTNRNTHSIINLGILIMVVASAFGLLLGSLEYVMLEAIYFPVSFILFGAGIAIPCALGAYSEKLHEYLGTASSIQLFCLTFLASLINTFNALLDEKNQIPLMGVFLITSMTTLLIFCLIVPRKNLSVNDNSGKN